MIITKGEFTRFSINARLQLLQRYGQPVLHNKTQNHSQSIFKIFNFYVELITTTSQQTVTITAQPVNDHMVQFYRSRQ